MVSFVSAIALIEVALIFFADENFVRIEASLRIEAFHIIQSASSNTMGACGAGGRTRQNHKFISEIKICQQNKKAGT